MQCPECGAVHDRLMCEPCMRRRSYEAYLNQQLLYLNDMISGHLQVRTARRNYSEPAHIVLMNDPTTAFCGEPLQPPLKRGRETWDLRIRKAACQRCVATFDRLAGKP